MGNFLKAQQITDKVYWVGAIDWNVRNFHGYQTGRGSTYNAFLIMDEKITLIDAVKKPFLGELMERISSVVDPAKIDYIVSNHAEMDHSGALPEVVKLVSPEKVFASPMGEKALRAHFGDFFPISKVVTGDKISLGQSTLTFVETKLLHWPDSMFSYLDTDKMLFSQDAFGMHLAGSNRFAEEYDLSLLEHEAKKYFGNILFHLAGRISELLNKLPDLHLDIRCIAPDHGPIYRRPEEIQWILNLYTQLAAEKTPGKALVFYSTMWESTAKMAGAIADGIRDSGIEVEVASLAVNERSAIVTKVVDSGLVVAGAPTMNNQMYPAMADVLTYLKGLRPKNRLAAAFGSYGWSGEAVKLMNQDLAAAGFALVDEGLTCKYVPDQTMLEQCFEYGKKLAGALKEKRKDEK
ncbi:MAG: FprA family A-type flavoprotein [Victivallaceae bacterium]|nr:FprA family A-type flavoprotein [Victivallaceae bacterium]